MKKDDIFRLLSLVGMTLGTIGTVLSNWADDKELDRKIDEKINKRLAASKKSEES